MQLLVDPSSPRFLWCVVLHAFPLSSSACAFGNFHPGGNFWVGDFFMWSFCRAFECKRSLQFLNMFIFTCCDFSTFIFPNFFQSFSFVVFRNICWTLLAQRCWFELNANGGHFKFNTSKGRVGGFDVSYVNRFLCPPPPLLFQYSVGFFLAP